MFSHEFIFFFPLTPYMVLMIHSENEDSISGIKSLTLGNANSEFVEKINFGTCSVANKEIYSISEKAIRSSWIAYYEKNSVISYN